MDFEKKVLGTNPLNRASLISKVLFLWIVPLISKGYKGGLNYEHLYNPREQDRATELGNRLARTWSEEMAAAGKKRRPKLSKALWRVFGKTFILCVFLTLIYGLLIQVLMPICLRLLIESLSPIEVGDEETELDGPLLWTLRRSPSLCAGCICLLTLALRQSHKSLGEVKVGGIANLLSTDVRKFDNFDFVPFILMAPIQLLIFTYLLWNLVGPAGFIATGVTLLAIPLQFYFATRSAQYREKFSQQTDKRGSLMSEILAGVRVIKMYCWEQPLSAMIDDIRRHELHYQKRREIIRGINVALSQLSARFFAFCIFLTYLMMGGRLTSMTVFFTLSVLFTLVRNTVEYASKGAIDLADIFLAISRIQEFLLLEEQLSLTNQTFLGTENSQYIRLKDVDASWEGDVAQPNLKNVNINLQGSQLVFIVGSVGSGKSSLLNAVIDEMSISSGNMSILGKLSYASQEPWIFAGTVRQNILFNEPFESQRYQETIRMCCLEQDLLQLPQGDMSMVGERGAILSGGQKARVNLARTIYRKADIYLLDDPLSAVDPKVSKELFENCIQGQKAGSMRILVTHQVQYMDKADYIIVLDKGSIIAQGSYAEIRSMNLDIETLITSTSEVSAPSPSVNRKVLEPDDGLLGEISPEIKLNLEEETTKELMMKGSVGLNTYWEYLKASQSPLGLLMVFMCFITAQTALSGGDYWLSYWTHNEEFKWTERVGCKDPNSGLCPQEIQVLQNPDDRFYMEVYTALLATAATACFLRVFFYFRVFIRISRNLHNSMFAKVIRAPVKFFDDNPSGRILNRFVYDLGTIDETLPVLFYESVLGLLNLIGVLVIVSSTNVLMILPTAFAGVGFYILRIYYLPAARDIKRLEAMAKGPLLSHMTASLQGIATVRSSQAQQTLVQQFEDYQDVHTGAWFLFICVSRWLGIWLEIVSTLYLTFISFGLLYLSNEEDGSFIGLAVYSVLTLMIQLQFVVRQSAEAENQMISVERALEYCKLTSEALLESTKDKQPPQDWPTHGQIEFKNVSLSYENAHTVLKNLTFEIRSGEKIGIVGRTGAGKSSIVSCLFRLVEPTGDIYIDGVRVNQIGLHDLRKNLSIIPQDPFLFAGTLRYNLDPFGQFGDHELLRSLEDVELKDSFPNLEYVVSDGGQNFSVGQRQLICLARAILRNNKIILMDEATANVDQRTDALIQKTIRSKFAHYTVITIAHRLNTVMHSDRIMVLDQGCIKEYDRPAVLLHDPGSWLNKMILKNIRKH